jgi:hypothetical protein
MLSELFIRQFSPGFFLCTAKTRNPGLNLSIGSPISSASGIIPVRNRAIDRDRLIWVRALAVGWCARRGYAAFVGGGCNNCRDSVRKEKPWPKPRLGREGRVACSTACSRISLLLLSSQAARRPCCLLLFNLQSTWWRHSKRRQRLRRAFKRGWTERPRAWSMPRKKESPRFPKRNGRRSFA